MISLWIGYLVAWMLPSLVDRLVDSLVPWMLGGLGAWMLGAWWLGCWISILVAGYVGICIFCTPASLAKCLVTCLLCRLVV